MVSFLDIEATSLDGESGSIIAYGIMEDDQIRVKLLKEDFKLESALIKDCLKNLERKEKIITWYGRRYDIPMIITRALKYGIPPNILLNILHVDLYEIAKGYMLLPRNHLEDVARFFGIERNSDIRGQDIPQLYIKGDTQSLQKIKEHLIDDLQTLQKIYHKMKPIISPQRYGK
jgi:uncharacterized protein YprB with RNaseH-like and TPR domain